MSFGDDPIIMDEATTPVNLCEEDSWFEMLECLGVNAERIEILRTNLNARSMCVDDCVDLLQSYEGGRQKLLSQLKAAGLTLRERQNLTNTFSRGIRAVEHTSDEVEVAHMILLQAAGFDAPSEAAATVAWGEQLDSDYEDAEEDTEEYAEPGSTPRGGRWSRGGRWGALW